MAKVYFKRKTTQEIEELPVEDGSLIYNTDNGKTYMDFGEDRIQTGGNANTMIAIGGDEAPTDTDIKLWFPNDVVNTKASEVVNNMDGDETDLAPSVNAVKQHIQQDIVTGGEPVKCGYKIDGKDVYVKRIQSGNLGDNTSTTIPTGLTNVTIIEVTGNANNGSTYIGLAGYNDEVYYNTSNIMWNTKTNRTAFKAYLNVYFTYNKEVS